MTQTRIPGLDGIRALSIILVLFAHLADGITPWSRYGVFGVESFFVLSGYKRAPIRRAAIGTAAALSGFQLWL